MTSLIEFDSVDPELIAARLGTPVFVLSQTILRQRLAAFADALRDSWPSTRLFYSVKANSNPWVLRQVLASGWGLDACSPGDLWLASRVGAGRESVSFTGVGVSRSELARACEVAGYVNICTPAQVDHAKRSAARLGLRLAAASSRSGIAYASNKFGLTAQEAVDAFEVLRARRVRVTGLHCHVGSGITEAEDLVDTLSRSLLGTIDLFGAHARSLLEYVNIGGGLGIYYDDKLGGMDPGALSEAVSGLMGDLSDRAGHLLELHCEPGEWVVGPAGALLTRVTSAFSRGEIRVAIVDASLNQYMGTSFARPGNAVAAVPGRREKVVPHDVFGATNAPGDVFCRGRALTRLEENDLVVLHCAGAYGFSRGGRFNEHPQAPEVCVDGTRFAVAREKESVTVLQQHVPESLEWREA